MYAQSRPSARPSGGGQPVVDVDEADEHAAGEHGARGVGSLVAEGCDSIQRRQLVPVDVSEVVHPLVVHAYGFSLDRAPIATRQAPSRRIGSVAGALPADSTESEHTS
jgi:hypothetical protein